MKYNDGIDDHFRSFTNSLEKVIERYGDLSEEDITERQKKQVEGLVALETEYRETLVASPFGRAVYEAFVDHIVSTRKNILAARPFFRERAPVFTSGISVALKARAPEGLYPFAVNYGFVKFCETTIERVGYKDDDGSNVRTAAHRLTTIARGIEAARTELVEMNLPLCINRSHIFWRKTPRSHLEYMDFIQIATEGLIAAVDKFCLPYSPVFRGVAIGRMVGNFIEEYSETMVHFYPSDKRKIYRANKASARAAAETGSVDFSKLADMVNEVSEVPHQTTTQEIAALMSAASCVSADAQLTSSHDDDDGERTTGDRFVADPEQNPEAIAERNERTDAVRIAVAGLTLQEQKFLKLKGVEL